MAKATASSEIPASEDVQVESVAKAEVKPARVVSIIIEKYLVGRNDIPDTLRWVFVILYKGQTHTTAEWDDIISRRLAKPAD